MTKKELILRRNVLKELQTSTNILEIYTDKCDINPYIFIIPEHLYDKSMDIVIDKLHNNNKSLITIIIENQKELDRLSRQLADQELLNGPIGNKFNYPDYDLTRLNHENVYFDENNLLRCSECSGFMIEYGKTNHWGKFDSTINFRCENSLYDGYDYENNCELDDCFNNTFIEVKNK